MQHIYLVRHTAPAIEKGICYGQSDIDTMASFYDEAAVIKSCLPLQIRQVYSSPLLRCKKLAEHLFPGNIICIEPDLKEINCGEWEMKHWDHIPKEEVDPWMQDFVQLSIPGGESYAGLYKRVTGYFDQVLQTKDDAVIITHGGVIRSVLSYMTQTPLLESFSRFSLHYGCVIKIANVGKHVRHEIVSNIPTEKEKHKPG